MSHVAWRDAWFEANQAFYTNHQAEDHFSTSIQADTQVAQALARLINQQRELHRQKEFFVVDVGTGSGRLLEQLRAHVLGDVHFLGVDIRESPSDLVANITWHQLHVDDTPLDLIDDLEDGAAVLIAHEFLDDIPCEIFELDEDSSPRLVLVDPATGAEELGPRLDDVAALPLLDPIQPDQVHDWLSTWWPTTQPGARRETGITRQWVWAGLTNLVHVGCAVAVDYAHTKDERARGLWDGGTLKGFRAGRPQRAVPDGSVNITAHVALDALAGPQAHLTTQDRVLGHTTLSSWPIGLGSYLWLIEPIGGDGKTVPRATMVR